MKILIVGIFAELVDLVVHLQEEGNEVYYYVKKEDEKDVGKGIVNLVKGWKQYVEEADIIIFPDVYFGDLPLELRKKGKLVVGGSSLTDRLENDRKFAAKVWQKFGLKCPNTYYFSSFRDAIEFVEKNPKRYVFKPQGQKPRFYTYISQGAEDLILTLKHFQEIWTGKPEFVLQEYIEGVEIACTGIFNGERFLKPFIVNFEEKRIGQGNIGPQSGEVGTTMIPMMKSKLANETILKVEPVLKLADYRGFFDLNCIVNEKGAYILEATCFTEDTEIMTIEGWKTVNELKVGDLAMTLNTQTGNIEYGIVSDIYTFKYNGPICNFHNRYLEFGLTPDHNVLHIEDGNYVFSKAQSLVGRKNIDLVLSGSRNNGTLVEKINIEPNKNLMLPADAFLYFLGLYIADGWHDSGRVFIRTGRSEKRKARIINRLIKAFPFPLIKLDTAVAIISPDLSLFLDRIGFARGNSKKNSIKRIPQFLFNYSPELLINLVDGLADGDGDFSRDGRRVFTADEVLAEQISLLFLYCGLSPSITVKKRSPLVYSVFGGHPEAVSKGFKVECDSYKGYVWCPTVPPYHTVLVRQNKGRPFFMGQCRPGIPTIHIMDGIIEDSWTDVFMSMATGKGSVVNFKDAWCVGVVMVSPPWPYEVKTDKYSDFPLFFPWKLVEEHKLHPGDIKLKEIDKKKLFTTAGNIGFTLVATGYGKTIDEAQEMVYEEVLPQVKFSLGWYRTDIGDRVKENMDFLKRLGYL